MYTLNKKQISVVFNKCVVNSYITLLPELNTYLFFFFTKCAWANKYFHNVKNAWESGQMWLPSTTNDFVDDEFNLKYLIEIPLIGKPPGVL